MAGYPKPIESAVFETEISESDFTGSEKVALTNAWKILKAKQKKHATEIFIRFFVANPQYLKWFKKSETVFNNEVLHAHPHWILQSFGSIIEEGLWDVTKLNVILSALVKCHKKIFLFGEDMAAMTRVANIYLKEVLVKYMSPTLESALNKLCDRFAEGYDYDEQIHDEQLHDEQLHDEQLHEEQIQI